MPVRIIEFKKGEPVPRWVLYSTCKHHSLIFTHDVKTIKFMRFTEVYPFVEQFNDLIEVIDPRPLIVCKIEKFIRKLLKKPYACIGRPTHFFEKPYKTHDHRLFTGEIK